MLAALGGCASLSPEHERGLAEVRELADAIARAYDAPAIPVMVGASTPGLAGTYRRGLFTVDTSVLDSPYRDAVVAHEMAHYLLGHDDESLRVEDAERNELDANAKVVEIFTRVRDWSEEQGIRAMYAPLLSFQRAVEQGAMVSRGHRPPCEEIADLLERFPRHAAWTGALECAPPAIAAGAAIQEHVRSYRSVGQAPVDLEPLLYAYVTDGVRGNGGRRLERSEFFVDGDRKVMLRLIFRNDRRKHRVESQWLDPRGVLRRTIAHELDLSTADEEQGTGISHGGDMCDVWLYPGRWTIRLSVNGRSSGTYFFDLRPGAGQ